MKERIEAELQKRWYAFEAFDTIRITADGAHEIAGAYGLSNEGDQKMLRWITDFGVLNVIIDETLPPQPGYELTVEGVTA